MTLSRRSLITGLVSFAITAPAIVRAGSLMPVKVMEPAATFVYTSDIEPVYFQNRILWVIGPQTIQWGPNTFTKRFDAESGKWVVEG